jgi:hypothetical protein
VVGFREASGEGVDQRCGILIRLGDWETVQDAALIDGEVLGSRIVSLAGLSELEAFRRIHAAAKEIDAAHFGDVTECQSGHYQSLRSLEAELDRMEAEE